MAIDLVTELAAKKHDLQQLWAERYRIGNAIRLYRKAAGAYEIGNLELARHLTKDAEWELEHCPTFNDVNA